MADDDQPVLRSARLVIRPLRPADLARIHEINLEPAVARWWPPGEFEAWPPQALGDVVILAIDAGDETIGLIQYGEEADPMYRHASVDLFLTGASRGRGLGHEAIATVAEHLFEARGHHRLVIDPALANENAIRCYERAGFRAVGVMRRYERDPESGGWRDGLLMDLLSGELVAPGG